MNMVDFSHNIPSDQLLNIFKNFFEQHMVAYDLLKDIDLVDFKVGKCPKCGRLSEIIFSNKIPFSKHIFWNLPLRLFGHIDINFVFANCLIEWTVS